MKAIVVRAFGGPEVLKVEDVPDPKPGPGQVLVALKAVGINPVETYVRSGTYTRVPALPYTPGGDAAGIVEASGPGSAFKAGQRVYLSGSVSGAYAEKALAADSRVHPLPEGVGFEQGAAMGVPYATAHWALFKHGGATAGETLLIHGASGGVGTAAVQLALAAGLRVLGTAGGPKGMAYLDSLGVHHAADHRAAGYLDRLVELCGGRGPDLIVEMLANVNLAEDLRIAAPNGRVVIVGSRGETTLDPRATMTKNLRIQGMSLANLPDAERAAIHAELVRGLEAGKLKPVISRRFALAEAPAAHEAVMEPGARGKLVLLP